MASTEYQTGDGASANNYSQHQDRFFLEDFDVWQNFTAPQADENEAILYQYEPTNEGHTEDTHEALSAEDIWRRIRTKQNGEFSEDFDELSSSNSLNVVEFRRCNQEQLSKDFLDLCKELNYPDLDRFLGVREAGKFFTGVRLSGLFEKDDDPVKSLLLTSIPILSIEKSQNNSLANELQYSPNFGRETVIENYEFKVYITVARCFAMDNSTIVMFKPDTSTFSNPLVNPGTHRHGAFYFLARMIETSLQASNDEITKNCSRQILIHQQSIGDIYRILETNNASDILGPVSPHTSQDSVDLKRPLHFNISGKTAPIGQHIELADMITDVMNDQVNVLEKLVKVFERSVPHPRENKYKYQEDILQNLNKIEYRLSHPPTKTQGEDDDEEDEPQDATPQHDNIVDIPVISKCGEQMPHVMKILDRELIRMKEVVRDHERRTAKLRDSYHQLMAVLHMKNMQMNQAASADELIAGVKSANEILKTLSRASETMNNHLDSTRVSNSTLKDASEQQLECMINMNQEAAYQGDLFSFFTVITTLFLPLGFLSQYAGLNLNAGQDFIKSHQEFWRIVGPITSAFAISIAIFITFKKYRLSALLRALFLWEKPVSKKAEKKAQAIANAKSRYTAQSTQASGIGHQAPATGPAQASGTGNQAPGLGSAHVSTTVP